MKIGAIIPARYNSSRFPGKPLIKISGISMIERVYNQVLKSKKFPEIIVATDSQLIETEVNRFNGKAVMTSSGCNSGTERIWEVMQTVDLDAVINIQGDEPLISAGLIADVADKLQTGRYPVLTASFFNSSYPDFISVNVVKVIVSSDGRALYFSRSPVPYARPDKFTGFDQHVGIYGYTRDSLKLFHSFQPSKLERAEMLEQLRFLDNGIDIHVIRTDYKSIGVDTPDDVKKIEKILEA